MTVIRPNSISGITSITAQANEINVFRSNGLLAGLNLNGVNFNTTAGISTLAALKITGNLDVEGVLTYQDVTNVDSVGIVTARQGVRVTADGSPSSNYISVGASNDLKIYHSGSHSRILDDATGKLQLGSDTEVEILNGSFNESMAKFQPNGAVELYHNNEKKLYTYGEGVFVQDDSSAGAYVVLATNAGTQGSLYGTANTLGFLDGQNHYMLKGVKDGAVELYNDNTKRLETTSTGAKVTGNLQFASAGQGIDFSASVHASGKQSELLDDYERGSWTPQFFNARTGGTQLTNPSNTQAHYVKVGRIVYLHLGVHGLTKNWAGSNTQIFIRGLPYRSYFQHNGHCIRCGYFGPTGVTYSTFANLRQYDTYMELQKSGGAQGRYEALNWDDIHWEGYGNITCEMVYETDQGV